MGRLSVIICTYNPVPFIFSKCLSAIAVAAKEYKPCEILIIDNNSVTPLLEQDYIQKFAKENDMVSILSEPKPGLTPARLKGINEASGEILLFIDDDNFIAHNYFTKVIALAAENTHIGAWSGQVKLVFEKKPEDWTRKYWGLLVHREFNKNLWSNLPNLAETMPCGAGLIVRKIVGDYYFQLHKEGKRNIQLDRSGKSLFSGGDNDLAACACDLGMGVGLFHELILEHYIPANRLEKSYLLKLAEGISASGVVFKSFRNEFPEKNSIKKRTANQMRLLLKSKIEKEFFKAVLKGEKEGLSLLKSQRGDADH
ncbi:MAG: glycosyltransferase family 2 protein [Saprospiraceae bacterium]|nr:glycosyltransferase family 2 protein [Saprospiraceae bacterium]